MGNLKVVINKFVILPKPRKEVGLVDFHLRNEAWQSTQGKNENESVMT